MKHPLYLFSLLCLLAGNTTANAAIKVFACEPERAALAQELGGDRIDAFSATTALQDPHRIEPRPSLIAKLRQADLLVCTGAGLEAGWLPMLLRRAGNANVQPGRLGYFEAAMQVERLEIPTTLNRAWGDIHAAGNPHVHLDPRRLARIAERLHEHLIQLDAEHATHYRVRYADFTQRWQKAVSEWNARAAVLKGVRVVSYHRDWVYLYDWLGLQDTGTLEPQPGMAPSASHLARLRTQLARAPARLLLLTPFQDPRPARWLADQSGLHMVVLPYTIGGSGAAQDLFSLFDDTLNRLRETLR